MTQPGTPIQTPERDGEAPAPERAPRVRRTYKAMEAKGPGHLSLRDVAEEARERKAVLPHHFESKENPILLAVRWMPARAVRRIRDAVSRADGKVWAMVDAVVVGPGFNLGFHPGSSDLPGRATGKDRSVAGASSPTDVQRSQRRARPARVGRRGL